MKVFNSKLTGKVRRLIEIKCCKLILTKSLIENEGVIIQKTFGVNFIFKLIENGSRIFSTSDMQASRPVENQCSSSRRSERDMKTEHLIFFDGCITLKDFS